MATSTDYGLAVYNEQGVNVLASNLFCPKLIGSLTLRLRGLNQSDQLRVLPHWSCCLYLTGLHMSK